MIVCQARPEDVFHVELQSIQLGEDPRDLLRGTDWTSGMLVSRTIWHKGQVVGCYGLTPCRPGVAEAWAFFSPEALRHPKSLFRALQDDLRFEVPQKQLRRVQAVTRADFPAGIRLLVHLGFDLEGHMRAFGPNGEDYLLFARIWNGRCG